ncbi:MAG: uracil-DNA glycosylase [Rhodobiaceae bacterium]|nr:uracil-DNA glycosylase [Rhodobiaceae bacterium]
MRLTGDPITDVRSAAAALIAYYGEIGVDCAASDAGIDRFAESEAALKAREALPERQPRAPFPSDGPTPRQAPQAPAMSNEDAAAAAGAATTLDELKDALSRFDGCALSKTATNLCFASGNPQAKLMFVGEAPGRDEDLQGEPFVGRAGQLLDRMLHAIGLDRTGCYIANTVYWRPPGNRNPNPEEMLACRPFIRKQIELVDPDVLVFLGGVAAKEMLSTSEGILKLRGRWREFDTGKRTIPAIATLHPAYLLRQPAQKKLAWKDFRAIRDKLA